MGLSGHPKVGRPRPGVPAAPPGEAGFPALAGASSPPPLRLPRGFPTLTTWPEAGGRRGKVQVELQEWKALERGSCEDGLLLRSSHWLL